MMALFLMIFYLLSRSLLFAWSTGETHLYTAPITWWSGCASRLRRVQDARRIDNLGINVHPYDRIVGADEYAGFGVNDRGPPGVVEVMPIGDQHKTLG